MKKVAIHLGDGAYITRDSDGSLIFTRNTHVVAPDLSNAVVLDKYAQKELDRFLEDPESYGREVD